MRIVYLISALVIAIGLALSGWFVAEGFVKSREPQRAVTVKGLSERIVTADIGFWPIRFVASGPTLADARATLETAESAVRQFASDQGFAEDDISVQNIAVEDRFAGYNGGNTPDAVRFVLTEDLLITSEEVEKLADAARAVGDLIRAGVVFSSDSYNAGPSFVFTGINDLKGEMLTEATQRAREAAQQFATESDSEVGGILDANQGIFQISDAVEIPNARSNTQIEKNVRVVTTIRYELID